MRNGAQLVLKNRFRVVQQAPDQRAFAIIYATRRDETQQFRMIKRNTFNG
jgi:hypothetical protein